MSSKKSSMSNLRLLAVLGSLVLVSGCSAGGAEIQTPEQALNALESVGFDCKNLSLRDAGWDNLLVGSCDTSAESNAVFFGFAPTKTQFVNSMRYECMQAVYSPLKGTELLTGDSWFLRLSDTHATIQSLESIQKDLGGNIDTVIGYCSSIE